MTVKTYSLTVCTVALLVATASAEVANPTTRAKTEVAAASRDLAGQLRNAARKIQQAPEKVTPSRWTSVLEGATEVQTKVAELQRLRAALVDSAEQINASGGTIRSRLAALEREFILLADESAAELNGANGAEPLPEFLLGAVQREQKMYRGASQLCRSATDSFAKMVQNYDQQIALVERSGGILDRMARASIAFVELARAGQEVEEAERTLSSFASDLNAILDFIDQVSESTATAIAQLEPRASKPRLVPSRRALARTSVRQSQTAGRGSIYQANMAYYERRSKASGKSSLASYRR